MHNQEISVLGCGPAGLLAAHALRIRGFSPKVYSRREKSVIPGAVHLQGRIPGITPYYPDNVVTMVRVGTAKGYAQKVYGDATRPTGWPNYTGVFQSWSVYKAYDILWALYEDIVNECEVDKDTLQDIVDDSDIVINTIPMPGLCTNDEHTFESAPYWIKTLPTEKVDEDKEISIFNGLLQDHWYRWSLHGGVTAIETTVEGAMGSTDVKEGLKAITNDCDCWPEVIRAGRWAKWQHGILLHHVFSQIDSFAADLLFGRTLGPV